jgi:S-adenosylmethionine:tRNA ribosyltransferase-isomerase
MRLSRTTGATRHHAFHDLPDLLRPGDLLVLNRSRVIRARLLGRRSTGGEVEALLVRQVDGSLWEALLRPSHRLRKGERIEVAPTLALQVESAAVGSDGRRQVRLLGNDGDSLSLIQRHGHVPLPPYIARADDALDAERYQTVFAREPGSVAAPTAGLHFTDDLLGRLAARGIERAEVVLHVGPGTFLPVRVDDVEQHRLPPESFSIPPETAASIDRARQRGGRVVAVGTTTTRALESAAADRGMVLPGDAQTALVVWPGYRFRAVDALITNFHLPRSSLLLLVSAFSSAARILAAYEEAIRTGYRFYSYGDAMLIDDWDDR